ncbi:MAG: hypothetical protein AAF552_15430 [Pseudomonadota bacterium]
MQFGELVAGGTFQEELTASRFDEALASFERARQMNPESESVLNNLARTRAIRDNALVSSSQ